jgi:cysteine desulfurase
VQTGGGQERARRAGTENVPYIVGMARALELAQHDRQAESTRLAALRDQLASGLLARIPDVAISGHPNRRLPGHLSLIVGGLEAEGMLIALDLAGVAASSGSACAAGSPTPSHVLTAMGYGPQEAMGALRLSLGRENTGEDIAYLLDTLPGIISRMRASMPGLSSQTVQGKP